MTTQKSEVEDRIMLADKIKLGPVEYGVKGIIGGSRLLD